MQITFPGQNDEGITRFCDTPTSECQEDLSANQHAFILWCGNMEG